MPELIEIGKDLIDFSSEDKVYEKSSNLCEMM